MMNMVFFKYGVKGVELEALEWKEYYTQEEERCAKGGRPM